MSGAHKLSVDVDLNKQAIRGWYAGADNQTKVSLYHRGQCLGVIDCTTPRPDVAAAGFHRTGACGFSFPAEEYRLQSGNLYRVVIAQGVTRVEALRLYGVTAEWQSRFVEHQLLPRDDYKYLADPTEQVIAHNCDLIAYKNLLIRLRRGKRGKSFKGKFIGTDYPHVVSDFTHFRFLSESSSSFWLKFLNARYLLSVIDTFADYGTSEERLGALAVSNYLIAERFLQTKKCLVKNESHYRAPKQQQGTWDGLATNHLPADDAMEIFLNRNLEILTSAPLMRSMFIEFMRRSARHKDSALGFNLVHSQYFRETFEAYDRHYFN